MKNLKKGFTLIELLVVVAIIGILASVVLASLNSARTKGADAAIKGNLSGARAQAELYYAGNGNSYASVCTGTATDGTKGVNAQVLAAGNALGGTTAIGAIAQAFVFGASSATAGAVVCHDGAAGWAAVVSLKSPATTSSGWCVDSTGASKEVTTLTVNSLVCGS